MSTMHDVRTGIDAYIRRLSGVLALCFAAQCLPVQAETYMLPPNGDDIDTGTTVGSEQPASV